MTSRVNDVTALADELLDVLFDAEPLGASLHGVPGYDDRLADPSEAADAELRARCADIAARAEESDDVTAQVTAQQARAAIDRIDARQVEYTVTDLFNGAASSLLTFLPMLT